MSLVRKDPARVTPVHIDQTSNVAQTRTSVKGNAVEKFSEAVSRQWASYLTIGSSSFPMYIQNELVPEGIVVFSRSIPPSRN